MAKQEKIKVRYLVRSGSAGEIDSPKLDPEEVIKVIQEELGKVALEERLIYITSTYPASTSSKNLLDTEEGQYTPEEERDILAKLDECQTVAESIARQMDVNLSLLEDARLESRTALEILQESNYRSELRLAKAA